MIIREWRGRTSPSKSAEYPEHFRRTVVPELLTIPGFLGAFLSSRPAGDVIEFVVLTRWASMDAVRAFAGADPEKAVVEPGAVAALIDYDRHVRHYEVIAEIAQPRTAA
jgi:heme-degrading monooxygenase HmoA